jgi:hypothetical protein
MTNPPRLARQLSESFAGVGLATMHQAQGVQFPLWSQGVSAQGTIKVLGAQYLPILSAGPIVHPRDLVLTDADGVVVVAMAAAPQPGASGQTGRRPRAPLGRPSCGATATAGARPRRKVGTPN